MPSANGLGYDVFMKMIQPLINQDYHLYFYISVTPVKDLFCINPPCVIESNELISLDRIPNAIRFGDRQPFCPHSEMGKIIKQHASSKFL